MLSTLRIAGGKMNGSFDNLNTVAAVQPWRNRSHKIDSRFASIEERNWIGSQIVDCKRKARDIIVQVSVPEGQPGAISKQYINYQAGIYRNNGFYHKRKGRPMSVPFDMQLEIVERLKADTGYKKRKDTVNHDFYKSAAVYKEQQNKPSIYTGTQTNGTLHTKADVCSRTILNYEKNLGINSGNAERTTNARIRACGSMRNMVTFAAANELMHDLTHPSIITNSDATTFEVGHSKDGEKIEVKYVGNRCDNGDTLKVEPRQNDSSSISAYFIKYYLHCSADGYCADPVFVVQDPNMNPDDIDVKQLAGFSVSTSAANSNAFLVFVKSRACNKRFYEWFNDTILIPFADCQRKNHDVNSNTLAFHQLDGEKTQIDIYAEPTVLAKLHEKLIVIGKPPGSTSSIT